MSNSPFSLTLNDGNKIPIIGLGNWRATKDEAVQAVKAAIDTGYRHFDTAFYYQNEKDLGRAFKEAIDEGKVKREELFITSKLWSTFHRADLVEKSLRTSLSHLGLEYLDLYLMHWPMSLKEGDDLMPLDGDKPIPSSTTHFTEAWAAMEECVQKGLVKSIGLSNFNKRQIETILKMAKIKPVMNQVECHPYLNQEKLRAFCESKGIIITAYAPLGSPYRVKPGDIPVIEDPVVISIAEKYGKKPGQIILRYQVQRNVVVIPKSTNSLRIKENFEIFNFNLSCDDMERLNSLNKDGRIVLFLNGKHLAEYPFNEPY